MDNSNTLRYYPEFQGKPFYSKITGFPLIWGWYINASLHKDRYYYTLVSYSQKYMVSYSGKYERTIRAGLELCINNILLRIEKVVNIPAIWSVDGEWWEIEGIVNAIDDDKKGAEYKDCLNWISQRYNVPFIDNDKHLVNLPLFFKESNYWMMRYMYDKRLPSQDDLDDIVIKLDRKIKRRKNNEK